MGGHAGDGPAERNGDGTQSRQAYTCRARRFAVKFSPPCIFLEYEDASKKTRVREVKLTKVVPDTEVDKLTRKVIRSFPRQLDPSSVKYEQVRKLVSKILDHLRKGADSFADGRRPSSRDPVPLALPSPQLAPSVSPKLPVTPLESSAVKHTSAGHLRGSADSDGHFSTSSIAGGLGSPASSPAAGGGQGGGGLGGVHVNGPTSRDGLPPRPRGQPLSLASHPLSPQLGVSGSVDEDVDSLMDELDRELGTPASGASRSGTPGLSRGASANALSAFPVPKGADLQPVTSAFSVASSSELSVHSRERNLPATPACTKSRFAAQAKDATHSDSDSDKLVLSGEHLDGDVDLNHVTEMELKIAKARMDQAFNQNRLRPGDPGYVYDKEVAFAPATENNDWDEDDEEEEEDQEPLGMPEQPGSERVRATPSTPSMHDRDAEAAVVQPTGTPHSGLTIDVRAGGSAGSGALGTGSSGAKDGTPESAFGRATGRSADLHAEFSYGDVNSPQPESVVDEVSVTKVGIDTDSDLSLDLPM